MVIEIAFLTGMKCSSSTRKNIEHIEYIVHAYNCIRIVDKVKINTENYVSTEQYLFGVRKPIVSDTLYD